MMNIYHQLYLERLRIRNKVAETQAYKLRKIEINQILEPLIVPEKNVHTEHCCVLHGCKYCRIYCPVWLGYQIQSYPCEDCCEDMKPSLDGTQDTATIPVVPGDILRRRISDSVVSMDLYPFD